MEQVVKATLREAREHNERLVLATIYDAAPVSRADVARLTGLTRTSVSDVVDGLIAAGLVRELGRGPSTGGKAPILLEVPDAARILIGVDLGDQLFTAAAVNLRGEIIGRVELASEDADGDEALQLAFGLIERLLSAVSGRVLGIGIGAPGLVDPTAGVVIQAVKRDWRDLPLGALVAERFGLPVYIANDSQAAALAEYVFGSVRASNLIVVKVGQGIGAGFVLNGELFQGDGFGAGEIGHTVLDPHADECRCGRRGCLETVASARSVLARLSECHGAPVTLADAVDAFERGDEATRDVVLAAGRQLGVAVAALVGALHVRRIVLAGTMAAFGTQWLESVNDAMSSGALPALTADTTLELGGIDDIVVLGASALLMTRELGLRPRPLRFERRSAATEAIDDGTAERGIASAPRATAAAVRGGPED